MWVNYGYVWDMYFLYNMYVHHVNTIKKTMSINEWMDRWIKLWVIDWIKKESHIYSAAGANPIQMYRRMWAITQHEGKCINWKHIESQQLITILPHTPKQIQMYEHKCYLHPKLKCTNDALFVCIPWEDNTSSHKLCRRRRRTPSSKERTWEWTYILQIPIVHICCSWVHRKHKKYHICSAAGARQNRNVHKQKNVYVWTHLIQTIKI